MTLPTLSNQKMTVRLSYNLQRRIVNDEKYIKNIHNSSSMEVENAKEEGFNSDRLIIDNKTTE